MNFYQVNITVNAKKGKKKLNVIDVPFFLIENGISVKNPFWITLLLECISRRFYLADTCILNLFAITKVQPSLLSPNPRAILTFCLRSLQNI